MLRNTIVSTAKAQIWTIWNCIVKTVDNHMFSLIDKKTFDHKRNFILVSLCLMSEITKTEEPQLQTPRQWLAPKMTNRQTFRPSKMSNCDTHWMETQTQQFITIYYPDYLRNKCCLSACRCRDFTYSKFLCLFFDKGIIFWISGNRQLAKFPNVTTMGNWGVSSHIHHNEVHFSHLWNLGSL